MGFDKILENDGFGIAATGMTIVFVALSLIAGFITVLPRIMQILSAVLPPEHHPQPPPRPTTNEDEAVVAAIGLALHHREVDTQ